MSEDSRCGNNKVSSFIKGSSILVLSNVCLKAINFFLLPLYTDNLTPAMIGISDSITTMTGILLPLLTMGLDSAFSAFYFDKKDQERSEKVFSTITWTMLIIGFIPLLLLLISPFMSELMFHTSDYSYIVSFALISVSFNLWYLPFSLELRLRNKMFLYGLSNVIASLTMVSLNIVFVSVLHFGESSLVLSTLFVHAENLLILLFFVKSKPKWKWFDKELLKEMMRFAAPLIPMTLMMWVLSLSDRYLILYFRGESDVGLYGIGLRFTNLMNVVISAVSMAYTTFAFSSKEDKNSKKNYYYIYNIESFLLMGIAFTVGLFGKEIIQLMTNEAYGQSYLALRDLMFSQTFFAMTSIVGYGIFFFFLCVYSLISVCSGAILNLGLNVILIPQYGIAAAALTTLLGYALHYTLTAIFAERLYPCNYGQKRVLISLIALYAICFVLMNVSLWIKLVIWVVCVVVIIMLYRDIIKVVMTYAGKILGRKRHQAED